MLNQKLQLKLSQKLSPQQIQLMKLIQMTTAELEQKVKNEIEENPALEHGSELSELIEDDSKEFDLDVHNEDINVDDYLTITMIITKTFIQLMKRIIIFKQNHL